MQATACNLFLAMALATVSGGASAGSTDCFANAAQRYQVSEHLLRAIASAESGNNAHAVHANTDGSQDIGVMQVNSAHLERLATFGITRDGLFDPCTNVMVGAWVLAMNIQRYGLTWRAVGSYNAGVRRDRDAVRVRYVRRVKPIYESLLKASKPVPDSDTASADNRERMQ